MLHFETKKKALEIHEKAVAKYNGVYEQTQQLCEKLYNTRQESLKIIKNAEGLISSIAQSPKEFGEKLEMISREREKFRATEEYAEQAAEEAKKLGFSAAAGVTGGAPIVS